MPSSVGASVAARMQKVGLEVQRANPTAVRRAALAAVTVQRAEIARSAPGGRLRGVGKSGARVGARFDVKGTRNATAIVRATGPLHLIENPIKPHEIRPKAKRGRGKKAILTPAGPRASAHHPGVTNPKRPWRRGLPKAEAAAAKVLSRTYVDAFRKGAMR